MKYLITGGCGFLGSNIALQLLKDKAQVLVLDNLYRHGSEKNLQWLQGAGEFVFFKEDVRNAEAVAKIVREERPDVIFHLAGQVAMTTSIKDPRLDFEVNTLGTFNVLEAVRQFSPHTIVIYSSTNKVYGDLEWVSYTETATRYVAEAYPNGFPEQLQLDFHSPYGVSKGSADQYMLDYHRIFGIRTAVFRHSSMYGGRQFSSYDQGWIGWFCEQALAQKAGKHSAPFTISGNGKQVRDVLHAEDMVSLYLTAAAQIERTQGQAFNIGGGMQNSLSLLELFQLLEKELGVTLQYQRIPPRESDQKVFVADISKVQRTIGWQPRIDKELGLRKMLQWVSSLQ